jgi:hypothetical protein
MAKPTVVPSWATTLANDVTSGQPNRAEPSAGKKITGFNFNEKPPRQDLNWLLWNLSKWAECLNTYIDSPVYSEGSAYGQGFHRKTIIKNVTLSGSGGSPLAYVTYYPLVIPDNSIAIVDSTLKISGSNNQIHAKGLVKKVTSDYFASLIFTDDAPSTPSGANGGNYTGFQNDKFNIVFSGTSDVSIFNMYGVSKTIEWGMLDVTLLQA